MVHASRMRSPQIDASGSSETTYASYLALAEALDQSVLLAGDEALTAYARRSLGQERVRSVA
jgi:predicted nucleic acid-binding protein